MLFGGMHSVSRLIKEIDMTCKDAMRKVKKKGWFLNRVRGSHYQYEHLYIKGLITIPFHGSKDLSPGVLHVICKSTGISL